MPVSKRALVRAMLTTAALFVAGRARAEDTPVEKPAVARPALPHPAAAEPEPVPAPDRDEAPQPSGRVGTRAYVQRGGDRARPFPYFAAGPGLISGLGGGRDFERTNLALTGAVGVEVPLRGATALGFELDADLELAGRADRGEYTAVLLRARLGQMLTPRVRLWGAAGIGRAGYQAGTLAGALAAGSSLLLTPKFGLDFSANLAVLGAASPAVNENYGGGAVLLIAVRALFELHR